MANVFIKMSFISYVFGCGLKTMSRFSFSIRFATHIWNATWEKVPPDMCFQWRLKSDCASAQSDSSLSCPLEETLHCSLSKMFQVKIPIRLCECVGWSECSRTAHVWGYVFFMLRLISAVLFAIYFSYNVGKHTSSHMFPGIALVYSEPSLKRQHLFPKTLPLKWICCCREYLISRLICKISIVLFLCPHRTYVLDIC